MSVGQAKTLSTFEKSQASIAMDHSQIIHDTLGLVEVDGKVKGHVASNDEAAKWYAKQEWSDKLWHQGRNLSA